MVRSATEAPTFTDEDPATGETLAVCPLASPEDVDAAVAAARAAQPAWAALDPAKRARILHDLARLIEEHAGELAETESRDVGKPISEASTRDLPFTIGTWEYYAGWPTKILGTTNPAAPGVFTATAGPKISSRFTRMELCVPVKIVGSTKWPSG